MEQKNTAVISSTAIKKYPCPFLPSEFPKFTRAFQEELHEHLTHGADILLETSNEISQLHAKKAMIPVSFLKKFRITRIDRAIRSANIEYHDTLSIYFDAENSIIEFVEPNCYSCSRAQDCAILKKLQQVIDMR